MSRVLYDQFILISLYAAFLVLLVKSDWFRKTEYAAGATGMALLCLFARYTIAPFLAASYLAAGYFSIRQGIERKKLLNIILSSLIICIVAGAYYINRPLMFSTYTSPSEETTASLTESFSVALRHLVLNQIGVMNFALLLISLAVFYIRKRSIGEKMCFLLISAFLPLAFFLIFPYKSWLPTTAGLVPLSVAIALFISKLNRHAWLLPLMFALLFMVPIYANSEISGKIYNEGIDIGGPCVLKACRLHILPFKTELFYQHLTPLLIEESYELSGLLNDMRPEASLLLLAQDRHLHPHVLKHYSEADGKRLYPSSIYMPEEVKEETIRENPGKFSWIMRFDYIVVPRLGFESYRKEGRYAVLYEIMASQEFKEGYMPEKNYALNEYRLPEFTWEQGGKGIILYKRKSP